MVSCTILEYKYKYKRWQHNEWYNVTNYAIK